MKVATSSSKTFVGLLKRRRDVIPMHAMFDLCFVQIPKQRLGLIGRMAARTEGREYQLLTGDMYLPLRNVPVGHEQIG